MNYRSIQKSILIITITLIAGITTYAQEKKASPAKTATANVGDNTVTINYSSPSVKGRKIWGGLVPYNKVWRTGANETTSIEVSKDCKIGGKELKAGKYALFTIPGKDSWTIIINKAIKWGAYDYKKSEDVLRFTTQPTQTDKTEMFDINISDAGKVTLTWDEISVPFEIKP